MTWYYEKFLSNSYTYLVVHYYFLITTRVITKVPGLSKFLKMQVTDF